MKILLLGSGGREHAMAMKIAESPLCGQLFIAPGNAGTASCGQNINLKVTDFAGIQDLVERESIDLIVVGPEAPLAEGISDFFASHSVKVLGPDQAGAQLESSKDYSKQFMQQYDIPTAAYRSFSEGELEAASAYIDSQKVPIVVKASGLAAGKGVLICDSKEEAKAGVAQMLSGESFGDSGKTVVIEEFLKGIEVSVFVLTDGTDYVLLPEAKDYKRIGEGDQGLNTGGMGSVSPVHFADEDFMAKVRERIIEPTLDGLQDRGITYCGFIFIGLMVVEGDPYVIEYNVRMGDPETEVVFPRIQSDVLEMCAATVNGTLADYKLQVKEESCAAIMLVSGGYPGSYEKGKAISGLQGLDDSFVIHAGTREEGGTVYTNGGRVLAVTSFGKDLAEAVERSQRNAGKINFDKKYFRRDIGQDVLG